MRGVKFDHVEPGIDRHSGRGDKLVSYLVHVVAGHGTRALVGRAPGDFGSGDQRPVPVRQRRVHHVPAKLGRALAARMAELEADFRPAVTMHEVGDPPPPIDMIGRIQAGTARRDPRGRRDTGHLGEHEPRAALGPRAIVNQVEIVRSAIDGRVGRHRRDDDPVLERHLAQPKRGKQRRGRTGSSGRMLPEFSFAIL